MGDSIHQDAGGPYVEGYSAQYVAPLYEVIPPQNSVCCFSSILHVVILILLYISGLFDSVYVLSHKRGEKEGKDAISF